MFRHRARLMKSVLFSLAALLCAGAPALADQSYGALSRSASTGSVGWSWSESSESAAESAANQACGVSDCQFLMKFHTHLCASFVEDSNGYGYDRADSAQDALNAALAQYTKAVGHGPDTNDRNYSAVTHCNADKGSGAADVGSALGSLVNAFAQAIKPAPSAAPVSQATPQPPQPAQPNGYFATNPPPAATAQRFALVGLKVYKDVVFYAITPVYAPLLPGNQLGTPVDAPRLGEEDVTNVTPTQLLDPGCVITNIAVQATSPSGYYGASVISKITVTFNRLGAGGISSVVDQQAVAAGSYSNAVLDLTPLGAAPNQFMRNFTITPVAVVADGKTYQLIKSFSATFENL